MELLVPELQGHQTHGAVFMVRREGSTIFYRCECGQEIPSIDADMSVSRAASYDYAIKENLCDGSIDSYGNLLVRL